MHPTPHSPWRPWRRLARRRWKRFAGKHALITGGSRGLGLVLARDLVRRGAQVALLARDEATLRAARDAIHRDFGQVVEIVACDLSDAAQLQKAITALLSRWARIDILVNNAGIIELGPAEHKPVEEYAHALAVHFWGPLHAIRAVIPSMRAHGGGRIVNISSIEGKVGFPRMAPYCASKFALTGLSDALRTELARDGIYITTVSPGLMRTGPRREPSVQADATPSLRKLLAAAEPLVSISAEQASRRILRACLDGRRSLELGWPTKLLSRANAFMPEGTGALLEWVGSLLPTGARPADSQPARKAPG